MVINVPINGKIRLQSLNERSLQKSCLKSSLLRKSLLEIFFYMKTFSQNVFFTAGE